MLHKKRFAVVCAVYAAAVPAMFIFINPYFAGAMGCIMAGSVLFTLVIARNPGQLKQRPPDSPLSRREERLFSIAERVVLVCAVVSLITWASIAGFYWELRSYFLAPGLVSCIFVALAIYGVIRPHALSGNIMRFQMMAAFGYVLAIPLIVAGVLFARLIGVGTSPAIFALLPMMGAGFFVQRWRERAVAAGA